MASWDEGVARKLSLPEASRWRWLPALGAHLGDGLLWLAVGAGLFLWGNAYLRGLALVAGSAVLVAAGISTAIKVIVRRHRPQELTQFYAVKQDRYSFPSGHAARMAAIAVVVGHFAPRWAPVCTLLALVVALCRVVVGVHYPSDVLAGLLVGSVGAGGTLLALSR